MPPVDPSAVFFMHLIRRLTNRGGITRTYLAGEPGTPPRGKTLSFLSVPRLSLCLKGTARYDIRKGNGTTPVVLHPGEALYMPPDCGMMPVRGSSYQSLGILFHPDFTRFLLGECKPSHDPTSWHRFKKTFHCPHVLDPHSAGFLEALDHADHPLVQNRLVEILLLSALQLLEKRGGLGGSGKARFTHQAACQFIDEHFHLPITREDVARHLHLHPNHISRIFAKNRPSGFNAYVRDLRLKKARSLLASPALNVAEIAMACGFSNAGYFARCYRQKYGRPPSRNRLNA